MLLKFKGRSQASFFITDDKNNIKIDKIKYFSWYFLFYFNNLLLSYLTIGGGTNG